MLSDSCLVMRRPSNSAQEATNEDPGLRRENFARASAPQIVSQTDMNPEVPHDILIYDDHSHVFWWESGADPEEGLATLGASAELLDAFRNWARKSPGVHDKWGDHVYISEFDAEGRALVHKLKRVVGERLKVRYRPLSGGGEEVVDGAG